MRWLTYNLWHGLSPSNLLAFEELEPKLRRQLREEAQLRLLRELQPDVCFMQEVCPVGRKARQLSESLSMDACVQPDLVGMKLFGFGFPLNLNSGLVTMASKRHGLQFVQGLSLLRPGVQLVKTWASWQTQEERFALFAETLLPKWGRVLVINTHLHHGLEATDDLLTDLAKLEADLDLPPHVMREFKERLAHANQRRERELTVLLNHIGRLEKRYEVVVLAGDMNASPGSRVHQMLVEKGFRDAWGEAHPRDNGFSFDHVHNKANHVLQERFPLSLVVEDLSFEPKVKEALMDLARRQEKRPRRIDYLWFRSHSVALQVREAELVGLPNEEGLAPSDHFGVYAEIDVV